MRSALQSEMHRDLENAREFLRQAASKEAHEEEAQTAPTALPAGENPVEETVLIPGAGRRSRQQLNRRWVLRVAMVAGVAIIFASLPRPRTRPTPVQAAPLTVITPVPEPVSPPPTAEATVISTAAPDPPTVEQVLAPARSAATVVPATPRPEKLPEPKVAPANGTLAVSSATSIDIYKDDVYLGSAPVSLELAAGRQTLEYRHGSLRKFVTQVINSNETTKAMVSFDVSVQINSKPWAEVFLEGTERKDLGQTPLSGVRVPIGGMLSFQNPQFQTKKYRVTGTETGIQIVFP
jgi:hypothetical protein